MLKSQISRSLSNHSSPKSRFFCPTQYWSSICFKNKDFKIRSLNTKLEFLLLLKKKKVRRPVNTKVTLPHSEISWKDGALASAYRIWALQPLEQKTCHHLRTALLWS